MKKIFFLCGGVILLLLLSFVFHFVVEVQKKFEFVDQEYQKIEAAKAKVAPDSISADSTKSEIGK